MALGKGGVAQRVLSSVTTLVNLKPRGLGDVEAKDVIGSIRPHPLSNNFGPINEGSIALPSCPLSVVGAFHILF